MGHSSPDNPQFFLYIQRLVVFLHSPYSMHGPCTMQGAPWKKEEKKAT
jgi:hypothetical protein